MSTEYEVESDAITGKQKEYKSSKTYYRPGRLFGKRFTVTCIPVSKEFLKEAKPDLERIEVNAQENRSDGGGHVGGAVAKLAVSALFLGYSFAERDQSLSLYFLLGLGTVSWGGYDLGQAVKQLRTASFLEKKSLSMRNKIGEISTPVAKKEDFGSLVG